MSSKVGDGTTASLAGIERRRGVAAHNRVSEWDTSDCRYVRVGRDAAPNFERTSREKGDEPKSCSFVQMARIERGEIPFGRNRTRS